MDQVELHQYDDGVDRLASPFESIDSNTTPGTEYSPPFSPVPKGALINNPRLDARAKLDRLTLEEKVCVISCFLATIEDLLTREGISTYRRGFLENQGDPL